MQEYQVEIDDQKYQVEIDDNGTRIWYQNGLRHRLDGPAVEYANGGYIWYQNGKCHREDGPALEYASGTRFWYQNDQIHRLDGPAIEFAHGARRWGINGRQVTEKEFIKRTTAPAREMTISEISAALGYEVKIRA